MTKQSVSIPIVLFFFSFATIGIAIVQAIQIPFGLLPTETARLATAPISHFFHTVAGALFGLIGPIQFGRVLAKRFGRAHRLMGRIFVISGACLALSSLSLLWNFFGEVSSLVSGGRLIFGVALAIALVCAMKAIKRREVNLHRDWMIRAYALGIGATAVSMVFIPIYAITGEPPIGLVADIAFIGSWALCVAFAEWVVHQLRRSLKMPTP